MGVGHHHVGGELEVLGLDQVDDGGLVLGELLAPAVLDALEVGGGDHRALAALARQEDAALLEGLAHAGDAELQLLVGALVGMGAACAQARIAVGVLELAAGEDQRAGEGIDRLVAHHHEDFEGRVGLAGHGGTQQQDSGRRTRHSRSTRLWRGFLLFSHAPIVP